MQNMNSGKKGFKKGFFVLIGLVVLGLAFLAVRQFGLADNLLAGTKHSTTTESSPLTKTVDASTDKVTINATASEVASISVKPPVDPVNPVRKGVAMLGGSGVFLYIVDTDGQNVKLVDRDLKKELVKEGFVATDDIKKILQQYIEEMYNKGVTEKGNIQFVVASSALADPKVSNIVKELEKYVVVNKTDMAQEGRYAALVAIPSQYRSNSFLVDVTPTLTRLTWFEGTATKTIELAGSKYFQSGKSDDSVIQDTKNKASQIPQSNRQHGYIIWAAIENGSNDRYLPLQGSYDSNDKNFLSGMNIINAVKETTGAEMFFDTKAAFPMGFLMRR